MDSVKVVVVKDGTYQDAKDVAKELSKSLEGWQLEGELTISQGEMESGL